MIPHLTICPYANLHTEWKTILCNAPGHESYPHCQALLEKGICPRIAELKKLEGKA